MIVQGYATLNSQSHCYRAHAPGYHDELSACLVCSAQLVAAEYLEVLVAHTLGTEQRCRQSPEGVEARQSPAPLRRPAPPRPRPAFGQPRCRDCSAHAAPPAAPSAQPGRHALALAQSEVQTEIGAHHSQT